jgi:hypothetical protein
LLLLLLLKTDFPHLYLFQEVIINLLACLNEELMSSNRIRSSSACLNSISKSLDTLADPSTILRILGHPFKFLQQLPLFSEPLYKYRYILPVILLQGFIILALLCQEMKNLIRCLLGLLSLLISLDLVNREVVKVRFPDSLLIKSILHILGKLPNTSHSLS